MCCYVSLFVFQMVIMGVLLCQCVCFSDGYNWCVVMSVCFSDGYNGCVVMSVCLFFRWL